MNRNYIRQNITLFSVLIFVILYGSVISLKPSYIYDLDGSLRAFGIGTKRKTILPAWFLAIILAIISYFLVLYYLAMPRLVNF